MSLPASQVPGLLLLRKQGQAVRSEIFVHYTEQILADIHETCEYLCIWYEVQLELKVMLG